MYRAFRSATRAARRLALPGLVLLACAPADDSAPEDPDAGAAAATAGGDDASAAFVDGPDLWLATLSYDADGVPTLEGGRNVTRRAGYDNQPRFLPDGSILYTRGVGDRTDIWRYDPAADAHAAVTETADQSEYSATPTPDGTGFSAIVVEPDSLQRLWRFDLDGSNGAPVFEDIAPVGYHAWITPEVVGMFVLGSPATLQVGLAGAAGPGEVVDEDIGRSLNRIPGLRAITYPVRSDQGWEVRVVMVLDGLAEPMALATIPSQDHAWGGGNRILYGEGHRLMAMDVTPALLDGAGGSPSQPSVVGALPDSTMSISRLAVSDDGTSIVLVVDRPQN